MKDRRLLSLVIWFILAGWLVPFIAQAADTHQPGMIDGSWIGKYTAVQGDTKLVLSIKEITDDGSIDAIFDFSALPTNPTVPSGSFKMTGHIDLNTRQVTLKGRDWIKRPSNYVTVNLYGRISTDDSTIAGAVHTNENDTNANIGRFEVKKNLPNSFCSLPYSVFCLMHDESSEPDELHLSVLMDYLFYCLQ